MTHSEACSAPLPRLSISNCCRSPISYPFGILRRNNIFVAENSADFLLKDPVEDIAYKPPPSGVIKVHIDGAFYQEKKEKGLNVLDKEGSSGVKRMGGWGAVYRDDTKITKILGGHLPDVKNAYEAEVEALYHALLGAKDLEYTDIVVQSDCQNVAQIKMNENVTDQKIVDMLEREDMQAASATTKFRIVQKKKKKID